MKWLATEINNCLMPAPSDDWRAVVGYAIWILSYAVRRLLVSLYPYHSGVLNGDWRLLDFGLTLLLTLAASLWFAKVVPVPKSRPEFVCTLWFLTRLFWEMTRPTLS
ncbi:MAG: hypothetical protein WCK51_14640 [Armatimonadota bacterium]